MKRLFVKGFTDASFEKGTNRSRGAFIYDMLHNRKIIRYSLHGISGSEEAEYQTICLAIESIIKLTNKEIHELDIRLFIDCIPAMERFKLNNPDICQYIDFQYIKGSKNPAHQYCKLPKRNLIDF